MSISQHKKTLLRAANLNHLWAQLLIEEVVRSGVETFFLAPGSRSTPLTTAVARHPQARSVLHIDERGAAFAALGYGRATGYPAAWITTSGTAVANGLPAVVEAGTDGVPMLLLTADRPPELRDTGANQTIDQVKIFGDYVRWQFDLPTPTTDIAPQMVLTTADQAVHRAQRPPPGPVHLNCMFRKPLAPLSDGRDDAAYTADLEEWVEQPHPYTRYPAPRSTSDQIEIERLAHELSGVERGIIVAGRLDTSGETGAVLELAAQLGWPLFPDITSNLRLGGCREDVTCIPYHDQLLASESFRQAHPVEAVLHVGGRFVSKRLRQYIAQARPTYHLVVRPDPARVDPGHQVTDHIESDVAGFCRALKEQLGTEPSETAWRRIWWQASGQAANQLDAFAVETEELSEPLVARLVAQHVPSGHALVVASSMPVRDLNRYGAPGGACVPVIANRGASGIDGTVATAAGVACGRQAPATLVIGDLALQHDLNALALLREHPIVVVALNNDGGGIFHFLPIAEHDDVFEPYFATPQGRSFEHAAALYELDYAQPTTKTAFIDAYQSACAAGRSALIEVRTDRRENHVLHRALEQRIAEAVGAG